MHRAVVSGVTATMLGVCLGGTALAGSVYKWVDPQGAIHYSDVPPPDGIPVVDAMRFDLPPAPPPGEEDYYSIANQARRLEAQRLALQRAREQRRADALRSQAEQLELEARERALQAQQQEQREEYGPSPYLLGYPYPDYPVRRVYGPWPSRPYRFCPRELPARARRHERPPADNVRPPRRPLPRALPSGVSKGMVGPAPEPRLPPPARR